MRERTYTPALRFDALTGLYDDLVRVTMRDELLKERLVEQARLEEARDVLDLGCGTGTLTTMIKRAAPNAHVTGVDIDPRVLELARKNVAKAGVDVRLVAASVTDLPFEDHTFDRVLSSLVLHHLDTDEKRAALAGALRVLRPGGELHVLDWGAPHDLAMRAAFLSVRLLDGFETTRDNAHGRVPRLMSEAGFCDVEVVERRRTVFGTIAFHRAKRSA